MRLHRLHPGVIALAVLILAGTAILISVYTKSPQASPTSSSPEESTVAGAPEDPADAEVHIPADHSLSADAYVAEGAPSADHIWTGSDYAQAGKVLEKLAANEPTSLPRAGS